MKIKDFKYYRHYDLENFVFAQGITKIGSCAFMDCTSLKEAIFPDSLKNVGSASFADCISLEKIIFSPLSKVNSIELRAFNKCGNVKEIVLPYSVEKIDQEAFGQCYAVESIVMPEHIGFLHETAFLGCCPRKIMYKNKEFNNMYKFLEYFEEEKEEELKNIKKVTEISH